MGPHYDQADGELQDEGGPFFSDRRPPGWLSLYRLGGEGIQIAPAGDLTSWDAPTGVTSRGDFRVSLSRGSIRIRLSPLRGAGQERLPRRLEFSVFLTLPNLPDIRPLPLRTIMVGNPPFPADDLLRAWADSGVELITIMEGASWGHGTDRFWRTGVYPCYHDRRDMRDLDRLIASAHRFGMRIIPYSCPTELHPEMPTFAKHVRRWHLGRCPRRTRDLPPPGEVVQGLLRGVDVPGLPRQAEVLSALRHDTPATARFRPAIRRQRLEVRLPQYGARPPPKPITVGSTGLWGLLGEVRGLLGPAAPHGHPQRREPIPGHPEQPRRHDRHPGGCVLGRRVPVRPEGDRARVLRAFPACRVGMVPCSTWYRVPPPEPRQTGLRDGIAKGLLLGSVPYSYTWWEPAWGYRDNWEALGMDELRFDDCFTGVVRCNRKDVMGARYHGDGRQVVVIANLVRRDLANIRWRCGRSEGTIRRLKADEYRFIEINDRP